MTNNVILVQSESPVYKDILKATAEFHMKQKNPKSAAEQLEKLRKLTDEDRSVLSMLFAAYSQFDAKKAKQYPYLCSIISTPVIIPSELFPQLLISSETSMTLMVT